MIGDMRTTRNDTTAWRTLAKGDADERDRNSARFWLSWRGEDVGARFYNRAGEPITHAWWVRRMTA